jgi:hypothetical protein
MAQSTTLQHPAASATQDAPRTGNWDGGNEPFKASYGKLMMWFFLLYDSPQARGFYRRSQRLCVQHAVVAHT